MEDNGDGEEMQEDVPQPTASSIISIEGARQVLFEQSRDIVNTNNNASLALKEIELQMGFLKGYAPDDPIFTKIINDALKASNDLLNTAKAQTANARRAIGEADALVESREALLLANEECKGEQAATDPAIQLEIANVSSDNQSLRSQLAFKETILGQKDQTITELQEASRDASNQRIALQNELQQVKETLSNIGNAPEQVKSLINANTIAAEQSKKLSSQIEQQKLVLVDANKTLREIEQKATQDLISCKDTGGKQLREASDRYTADLKEQQREASLLLGATKNELATVREISEERRFELDRKERERLAALRLVEQAAQEIATSTKAQTDLEKQLTRVREEARTREITLETEAADAKRAVDDQRRLYEEQFDKNQDISNELALVRQRLDLTVAGSNEQAMAEVKEAQERNLALQEQLRESSMQLTSATRAKLDLENDNRIANAEIERVRKENEDIEKDRVDAQKRATEARQQLITLQTSTSLTTGQTTQVQQQLDSTKRELEKAKADKVSADEARETARRERGEAKKETANLALQLTAAQSKVITLEKEIATLRNADITTANVRQQVATLENDLRVSKASLQSANSKLQAAEAKAKREADKNTQLVVTQSGQTQTLLLNQGASSAIKSENDRLKREIERLNRAVAGIALFDVDPTTKKLRVMPSGSFKLPGGSPAKTLVLLSIPERLQVDNVLRFADLVQTIQLFRNGKPETFVKYLDREDTTLAGKYVVLTSADLQDYRDNYGKCAETTIISTRPVVTSTTTTTSTTTITGPTVGPVLTLTTRGLGAAVNLQTHITMLNQANWQLRAQYASDRPGPYIVDVHFSTGNPALSPNKELQFRAWNAHLLENPIEPSAEAQYVIDLTKIVPETDLKYGSLGSLVRNAIYGQGFMAIRVIKKSSGETILLQENIPYNFIVDPATEYNTKVILRPTNNITFYARSIGGNTYILETILIKGI